jgi:hypothetical protein
MGKCQQVGFPAKFKVLRNGCETNFIILRNKDPISRNLVIFRNSDVHETKPNEAK